MGGSYAERFGRKQKAEKGFDVSNLIPVGKAYWGVNQQQGGTGRDCRRDWHGGVLLRLARH